MERIEIGLNDIFREPEYLALILNKLNKGQLYALIGCSFIIFLRKYPNGKDIDFNKPDEIKQALYKIWKNVEKDLLLSYNTVRK